MATHRATVYSRANYGDEEITLSFPAGWEVTVLAPEATPALAESQRQAAFDQPIGTPRIAEMACAKKSAAIVVDDLSRPTPARELIPFVLRELSAAGVPSSQIRFVVGTGSHRPLTTEEMALKVGADILGGFQVTCHNFMSGELRGMGNLQDGTPVFIFHAPANIDQDQISNELRYAGSFGNTYLTTGVYFFSQDIEYVEQRHSPFRQGADTARGSDGDGQDPN